MTMSSGVEILWTKMTSIKVEMHNLSVCSVVQILCSALELQKLSEWNFALIIVGVILFVVGVCVAIVLAVLLTRRIKAGCMFTTGDLYLTLLYNIIQGV